MGNGELSGKPDGMLGGNVVMEWHPIQGGGVVILLIALCIIEPGISCGWMGY